MYKQERTTRSFVFKVEPCMGLVPSTCSLAVFGINYMWWRNPFTTPICYSCVADIKVLCNIDVIVHTANYAEKLSLKHRRANFSVSYCLVLWARRSRAQVEGKRTSGHYRQVSVAQRNSKCGIANVTRKENCRTVMSVIC